MQPRVPPSVAERDRCRGCLLGLAVGDSIGAAVEFKAPGTFEPVTGYRAGGPHGLKAGQWTDDTSMALALADSIGSVGWDLNDQARRYLDWRKHGTYSVNGRCFDIGITTANSLHRFEQTGDARTSGPIFEQTSGNGSIMRLAPVPIAYRELYPQQISRLAELCRESSLPTHRSPDCLSACAYFGIVLAGLLRGESREQVLRSDWPPRQQLLDDYLAGDKIRAVALGSFREKSPPAIRGSGYVVHSLEAALWAFWNADTFEDAVLRAANLGEDADTTAAVAGQLAGAHWGETGIPRHLLDGLDRKDLIEVALAGLLDRKDGR